MEWSYGRPRAVLDTIVCTIRSGFAHYLPTVASSAARTRNDNVLPSLAALAPGLRDDEVISPYHSS